MLTIIGGLYRHRKLILPPPQITRPTSQRARSAVFNILQGKVIGSSVMDVFAGSGAMGLEALSRGAHHITFLENHPLALKCLHQNIENLAVKDKCTVLPVAIESLTRADKPLNLIFIDPPYQNDLSLKAVTILHDHGWIDSQSLIVVESKERLLFPSQWAVIDERRYGIAKISFLQIQH